MGSDRSYGNIYEPKPSKFAPLITGIAIFVIDMCIYMIIHNYVTTLHYFGFVLFTLIIYLIILFLVLTKKNGHSRLMEMIIKRQSKKVRKKGQNVFITGGFTDKTNSGTNLPGMAAQIEGYNQISQTEANKYIGILQYPLFHQYVVVLECQPEGIMATYSKQDRLQDMFARLYEQVGDIPGVINIQSVAESARATGYSKRKNIDKNADPNAPIKIQEIANDIRDEQTEDDIQVFHRIAILFEEKKFKTSSNNLKYDDTKQMLLEISRHLPAIENIAREAGLAPTFMEQGDIAEFVDRCSNPDSWPETEINVFQGKYPNLKLAGPTNPDEHVDMYYHSNYKSISFFAKKLPESNFHGNILWNIIKEDPNIPLQRLCINYRPYPKEKAAKIVDKRYENNLYGVQNRQKPPSVKQLNELDAAQAQREEQARGSSVARLSIYATITMPIDDDEKLKSSMFKSKAMASKIEMEEYHNGHSTGWLVTLGLGLNPSIHKSLTNPATRSLK